MVPCKSTAEEVLFEWSHHRISPTDTKVRTALHVSIIESGSESVSNFIILLKIQENPPVSASEAALRELSMVSCNIT